MLLDVPADETLDKLFLGGKISLDFQLLHFLPFLLPSCQKKLISQTTFPSQGPLCCFIWLCFWERNSFAAHHPTGLSSSFLRVSRDGFCSTHRPLTMALHEKWPPLQSAGAQSSPPTLDNKSNRMKQISRKRNYSHGIVPSVGKWYFCYCLLYFCWV